MRDARRYPGDIVVAVAQAQVTRAHQASSGIVAVHSGERSEHTNTCVGRVYERTLDSCSPQRSLRSSPPAWSSTARICSSEKTTPPTCLGWCAGSRTSRVASRSTCTSDRARTAANRASSRAVSKRSAVASSLATSFPPPDVHIRPPIGPGLRVRARVRPLARAGAARRTEDVRIVARIAWVFSLP